LLARGHVVAPTGHSIRMVAFGDVQANHPEPAWTPVPMRHVVQFLQRYLRTHWNVPTARADQRSGVRCTRPYREMGSGCRARSASRETRRKEGAW
jgi:hypothetical protein